VTVAYHKIDFNRIKNDSPELWGEVARKEYEKNPRNFGQNKYREYVRRPLRGITLRKETYATITVAGKALVNSSLPPTSSDVVAYKNGNFTTNFLLQSLTETRNEKAQYIPTFGATYAYFFGESPRLINCSAILLSTNNFDWEREWWVNYANFMRGTSLVASNSKVRFEFDEYVICGYMVNATTIRQATDPSIIQLNFSLFVSSVNTLDVGNRKVDQADARSSLYKLGYDARGPRDPAISTTAAVRKMNIKMLERTQEIGGFTGFVRGVLDSVDDLEASVGSLVRTARNFLYGRNLVVPVGYVSERASKPLFPEGTGAEGLAGKTFKTEGAFGLFSAKIKFISNDASPDPKAHNIRLRTNTDSTYFGQSKTQLAAEYYYQNIDEYVTAGQTLEIENFEPSEYSTVKKGPLNAQAVSAWKSMGIDIDKINSQENDKSKRSPAEQAAEILADRDVRNFWLSILGRTAYGVSVYFIGKSIVEKRRKIQKDITNPNRELLEPEQIALLEQAEATESPAEARLRREAAAKLRGNRGTISTDDSLLSLFLGSL